MSVEAQQTVPENPAGPATGPGNADTTATTAPTTETPNLGSSEGKPSEKGLAEAVPILDNKPKEEDVGKGEVLVESHPINEGVLNLKAPGLKGLIPNKKYFWVSDSPLDHKNLVAYISNEKAKDIAHSNAAHATQTGKGLLFYAKRVEDKDHPQGIFNLADASDLAKGNANDFSFLLHGHKYHFQAISKSERDGWLVTLEPKVTDAKTSRAGIFGSAGYKSQLEKFGKPAAVSDKKSKTRSLSRPNKDRASKSGERTAAATSKKDPAPVKDIAKTETATESAPTGTIATTPAATDPIIEPSATTASTENQHNTKGETANTPATGAVTGNATRKDSTSDDEKKSKKARSQSRSNKRSSIFGGLLAKKEENDEKKAVKKVEKEEKREDKVIASEIKKEEKAEIEAEKAAEHEAKHDETGKVGGFDAAAVASRVVGAPVIPVTGTTNENSLTPAKEASVAPTTDSSVVSPATNTASAPAKSNKRASVFGGLFGKKDSITGPTATEASPVVPPKDEPAPVASTAPQLDNPVASLPSETPAPTNEITKVEPTPAADTASPVTAPTSATTPTDKRRTSFFSSLGTKKEKRTGAASGDDLTDGETKKQSGGFGGLLRKASRAQPKRDSKAPAANPAEVPKEGTTGEKFTKDSEQPISNIETPATTEAQTTEQKPGLAEREIVPNPIAKSEEAPAVKATA